LTKVSADSNVDRPPSGRRRIRRRAALAVAAVLALSAGLYVGSGGNWFGREPTVDAAPLLGLALPDTGGTEQKLAQWRGKVLVVNFWATWCVPCREEMPLFASAQRDFGDRGLQFVGIAIDDPPKIEAFVKALHVDYPILVGGYGAIELSKTLGNRLGVLPFTVILARDGRVAMTRAGPFHDGELRAIIGQLL